MQDQLLELWVHEENMSLGNEKNDDVAGNGCDVGLGASMVSARTPLSNTSLSRAVSLSATTSANILPRGPSSEQMRPIDNESGKKKRRLEDGGAVEATESNIAGPEHSVTPHDSAWEQAYHRVETKVLKTEEKLLQEQARRLDWQNRFNEKEITAHQIKIKHMNEMVHLKAEAARMYEGAVQQDGVIVDLRHKITQRDITVTQLAQDKNGLRLENVELKAKVKYLLEHASAPMPRREASCVPHSDPSIHSDDRYEHPNAPRKNALYKYFHSARNYWRGAGKVRPGRYGSGLNWDLGLCLVTFTSKAVYSDVGCEYRHDHLDPDERLYMGFLTPNGPSFITSSDKCMMGKTRRST